MEEFKLTKAERLSNRNQINALFQKGNPSFHVAPFRLVWLKIEDDLDAACRIIIVCPKKRFKRAHTRNRIRRQIREFYRLHKNPLLQILQVKQIKIALAVFYQGPDEMDFNRSQDIFVSALQKLAVQLEKNS
ncbi:MAG: ribonuclease P protein component [Bacteroidia bacterium]